MLRADGDCGEACRAAISGALRLCGRGLPVEPGQPGKIIGEIRQADLGAGAEDANGAHDQTKSAFLGREDVLNAGTHPSASSVAAGDVDRHLATPRLLALELRRQTAALKQGEIRPRTGRRVSQNIAGGVVVVRVPRRAGRRLGRRMSDRVAPKAVLAVDADVVLVAKDRHGDFRFAL